MIRRALLFMVVAGVLAAVPVAALASQTSNSQSPMYHGDYSHHCNGGTLANTATSGNVATYLNPDGTVTININIRHGVPGGAYHVSIACQGFVGWLTTNKQGNGAGHFVATPSLDLPYSGYKLESPFYVFAYDSAHNDRFVSGLLTGS